MIREQNTERVDVAAHVNVELIDLGLLGRHVFQRTEDVAEAVRPGLPFVVPGFLPR